MIKRLMEACQIRFKPAAIVWKFSPMQGAAKNRPSSALGEEENQGKMVRPGSRLRSGLPLSIRESYFTGI